MPVAVASAADTLYPSLSSDVIALANACTGMTHPTMILLVSYVSWEGGGGGDIIAFDLLVRLKV